MGKERGCPPIRACPRLPSSPTQRTHTRSWARLTLPVSCNLGHLCHPQEAAGQGKPRRRRHGREEGVPCAGAGCHLATSGRREPRGSLCPTVGNRGLGRAAHTRGAEARSESAPPVLNGPSVPTAQSVAGRPGASPGQRPHCVDRLPAAVLGLRGCGCRRHSSAGSCPGFLGRAPWRPRPVPSVWGPGFHPGAGLGGQGHGARSCRQAERRPAPAPASCPAAPAAVPGSA